MNDQTGKRKTAIFWILLAGLVLAAALLFDDYRKSPGQAVMEGHYLFDGKKLRPGIRCGTCTYGSFHWKYPGENEDIVECGTDDPEPGGAGRNEGGDSDS